MKYIISLFLVLYIPVSLAGFTERPREVIIAQPSNDPHEYLFCSMPISDNRGGWRTYCTYIRHPKNERELSCKIVPASEGYIDCGIISKE